MRQSKTAPATIHSASCEIWETPASLAPDVLFEQGYEDETIVAYLSAISPIYNALSRVLAQFSGLLLLFMNAGRSDLSLDHPMYATALSQLLEAGDRLAPIKVPPLAVRHHQAIEEIASQLCGIAKSMDNLSVLRGRDARNDATLSMIRQLHSAQRLLIGTAEPGANIAPVDFGQGCCSCGKLAVAGSTKHFEK